ncbi:hypothetical protein [Crocosphaera chwakensis]|uniref:Lipoprotein n=1 Tax=Crocosphaera chwakensis CCY0110 TaxID=391612 RepID=A3IXC3_9CHRO|nr:hypothetical protein [Crocosphaera chwakensis]EAZ88866.1 hypothetical protein CY0110_31270 [Crocosphaera chwakensis CCY0110]
MNKLLKLLMVVGLLGGCTSITANENSPQPVETEETSSIPPMSSFSFELCNVYFVLGECQTFPEQKHWGEVKEIKVVNVSEIKQLQQKNSIQIYVKSQGCYGPYNSPQQEAWYPISQVGLPREGKEVQAKLVNNSVMEPKFREAFIEIDQMDGMIGGGSIFSPEDCNPIKIDD